VFSEKIPENVSGRLRKSEIPEKSAVFRFSGRRKDTAYFWKIRGKKFPGKSDVFRRKISKKNPENSEIRKISEKKVQKRRFWKIQPSFAERV
jgi:hypothetical protein